jgi:L-amino acid N-acyltransferase YncA
MSKGQILSVINNTVINIYGTTNITVAKKTIASIRCSTAGRHVYVNYIKVDSNYRNTGIASAIVNRMVNDTDKEFGALCLDTSFGLFERCGFVNCGIPVNRINGTYQFDGTRCMIR